MCVLIEDRRLIIDPADEPMIEKLRRILASWRVKRYDVAAFLLDDLLRHGELCPIPATASLIQHGFYRAENKDEAHQMVASVIGAVIKHDVL